MTPNVTEAVLDDLRAVAARKRITQQDLATALDRTPMWVSRRLRGVTPLTLDEFTSMCSALGVTPVVKVGETPDVVAALTAERFGVQTR